MAELGKSTEMSKATAHNSIKNLCLTSYVWRHRHLISAASKKTRVTKGKKLLSWMKKNPCVIRIFSDEKFWTADQPRNPQNDCYLAKSPKDVPPINRTKHPPRATMLGVVGSDGKAMPPYWFPSGLKVGTKVYLDVMENVMKPWLDETYPKDNCMWQQDSAPAHKFITTHKWCKPNIVDFWPWSMWPPSSPDCSLLDYGI